MKEMEHPTLMVKSQTDFRSLADSVVMVCSVTDCGGGQENKEGKLQLQSLEPQPNSSQDKANLSVGKSHSTYY